MKDNEFWVKSRGKIKILLFLIRKFSNFPFICGN